MIQQGQNAMKAALACDRALPRQRPNRVRSVPTMIHRADAILMRENDIRW
jgi:hypothetical protein